ncbi:uncharacterized protein LOC128557757 [Mercenaria mercenaria]|uniref:uncharacterized protein LOC128557757 n=1 Tax=Mercenaria mercenaria TaxID=6596 RepID=UPI00234E64A2|nr:uncharacterized protein LOC128557757 [Mercenaria mercenaria]
MSDTELDTRERGRISQNIASEAPPGFRKEIVEELEGYFNSKFTELKRDFKEDSEWAAENVRKKVRTDNSLSFKNVSNRKQYLFNADIADLLDSAQKAINLRNASKATDFLEEAKSKIKHRNKLICIADSSSAGWLTIQEYEQNEVASDSDDDKKIRRAEERAKAKLEKSKKFESDNSSAGNSNQSFRSYRRELQRNTVAGQQKTVGSRDIVCYACGGVGHFATGCAAHLRMSSVERPLESGTSRRSAVPILDNTSAKPETKEK